MTLKELSEITLIPYDTLRGWSSKKNDYRKKLVLFLKDIDRSVLLKYFSYKDKENIKIKQDN